MPKSGVEKPQAKDSGHKPEHQMVKAHAEHGIGGLREKPRYRRKADQQNRHQEQQSRNEPENFAQSCGRAAQAGKNVETRQADH